jgi:hypothetical protein
MSDYPKDDFYDGKALNMVVRKAKSGIHYAHVECEIVGGAEHGKRGKYVGAVEGSDEDVKKTLTHLDIMGLDIMNLTGSDQVLQGTGKIFRMGTKAKVNGEYTNVNVTYVGERKAGQGVGSGADQSFLMNLHARAKAIKSGQAYTPPAPPPSADPFGSFGNDDDAPFTNQF